MPTKIFCPICKKETSWQDNPHRPFCSERCRTRDLGHWASEKYGVPGDPVTLAQDLEEDS